MIYAIFCIAYAIIATPIQAASAKPDTSPCSFFYVITKEPDFSGHNEIVLGPQESLLYAFHAEHEDTAAFLKDHLYNSIKKRHKAPIVITQELCPIMQDLMHSFLTKQDDPFNLELQKVTIIFLHPIRNSVSIHHIQCVNGKFKPIAIANYKNIIADPKRLFISTLTHNDVSTDTLSSILTDVESNALTKAVASEKPHKLLEKLLSQDNSIRLKGLIAISGYQWLEKTRPTFATNEYRKLAKKMHAAQSGKPVEAKTPLERSFVMHAHDTREQLLQFAAQQRAARHNHVPQFALDFLDDMIEEKKHKENDEQHNNRLLCFVNLIP